MSESSCPYCNAEPMELIGDTLKWQCGQYRHFGAQTDACRIRELEKRLIELDEHVAFVSERHRKALEPAIKLWRKEHNKDDLYYPDLWTMVPWLMQRNAKLEALMQEAFDNCEQCRWETGSRRCARCITFRKALDKEPGDDDSK